MAYNSSQHQGHMATNLEPRVEKTLLTEGWPSHQLVDNAQAI